VTETQRHPAKVEVQSVKNAETVAQDKPLITNRTVATHVDQLGQTLTQPTTKELLDKQKVLESTFYMASGAQELKRVQRVSEQEDAPRQASGLKNMFVNGAPQVGNTEPRRVMNTKKTVVNNVPAKKVTRTINSTDIRCRCHRNRNLSH
jgi:hypothetical protein